MKKYCIAGLALCLLALWQLHRYQSGGFAVSKLVSTQLPLVDTPPSYVDPLLDQPFHFLGAGGTCFAFLGEDGKTVLKLFKHQHLVFSSWLFQICFPGVADALRIETLVKQGKRHLHKRQAFLFASCRLAEKHLKEETGLLYLCLQPNPHFKRPIRLIDAWGIPHTIKLSQTEFALQSKTESLFVHLGRLWKEQKVEEIKKTLDALVHQIRQRCQLGIGDRDPNLLINFGWIDGRVVEFDLGSYYSNPGLKNPLLQAKELYFSTFALQKWLEKHSPDLLDYLVTRITENTP